MTDVFNELQADLTHMTVQAPIGSAVVVPAPTPHPMDLLAQAVSKGVDAAQLEKLVDLHERWVRNRAAEEFNRAMNAAQQEMPVVVRDKDNQQTHSRYATLDNVNHACKGVWTKHGFALSFSEGEAPVPNHKRTVCRVMHAGGHVETHYIDLPVDGVGPKGNPIGGMNAVQGSISSGSYGQRVLTCRIFALTIADTDLDGQGETITGDHVHEINDLLDDCNRAGAPVDFAKFLLWLGVEKLSDLPLSEFLKATRELNRKRRSKEKK